MAQATLAPLTQQTDGVVSRLAQLRGQIARWFWVDGLARVAWVSLILLAADFLLDWLFHLDLSQRGAVLLALLGGIAWTIYRRLVRPLSGTSATPTSDVALCLRVEQAHPELGQSLISALQLSRMTDEERRLMSPQMVQRAVQAGTRAAEGVNFADILSGEKFWRNLLLLLAGIAAYAGLAYGVTQHKLLGIWFNRNLLLGNQVWPQKTFLVIERAVSGKVRFPRGEDWTQIVSVREDSLVLPSRVQLDFRRARGRTSQAMKLVDSQHFELLFSNVLEPFEFRARGGDDVTDWVTVDLVEPPAAEELTLEALPPSYTGLPPQSLPAGKGPYFVLQGSSLRIAGKANKPLGKATLVRAAGSASSGTSAAATPPAATNLSSPLVLAGTDSRQFSGEVTAASLADGQYTLELEDSEGLVARRPTTFGIRLRPDREPKVKARVSGVSGMVLAKARIPLSGRMIDDFGLTAAGVRYEVRADGTEKPLQEGLLELSSLKEKLATATTGEKPVAPKELAFEESLDLETLKLMSGTRLKLVVQATDNVALHGANIGRAPDIALQIVTEDELRNNLLEREKLQRQELERLLKLQDELWTDLRAWQAQVLTLDSLPAEQRDQLMQIQRRQKGVAASLTAIAERMSNIAEEVVNNRLEPAEGKLERRLREQIIAPLVELATQGVPSCVQGIDDARRQASDREARGVTLSKTVDQQKLVADEIRKVLAAMAESEDFQKAVNMLYEIQRAQQEVLDRTQKERERKIREALEKKPEAKAAPESP